MLPTVVVVEDEEHLRDAVVEYLEERGLRVLPAANAAAFRELARTEPFHVVILDIAMPGEDGLSLARWLRQWPNRPGIIFATSAGSPVDRIVGLEIGADDYVVKPFDLRELLARIRSLLRRMPDAATAGAGAAPGPATPAAKTAKVGRFTINFDARRLTAADGVVIELTSTEFELLAALVARPNRIFSRAQLLSGGQARGADEGERSIDIRVTRLRRKIEVDPQQPELIQTVRGEGYMFVQTP